MPAGDMEDARFHRELLIVLNKILHELRESNTIAKETNEKFDDEEAKLEERVDETIQLNRDINLGLKELNRSVEE